MIDEGADSAIPAGSFFLCCHHSILPGDSCWLRFRGAGPLVKLLIHPLAFQLKTFYLLPEPGKINHLET